MKLYTIGVTQKSALDRSSFEAEVYCLLCSEPTPAQCHRRLVAERMARAWPGMEIVNHI